VRRVNVAVENAVGGKNEDEEGVLFSGL